MQTVEQHRTTEAYEAAFQQERREEYPDVSALERRLGFAVDREFMEGAARVLACPLKVHAPCWQHGRVIYAVARRRLSALRCAVMLLDVGTAKGFSALCARWALRDSRLAGRVVSVDVIDPRSKLPRNSVADLRGPLDLRQILSSWPESDDVEFHGCTGVEWLLDTSGRVHFAFLDGKHTYESVSREIKILSGRQEAGDVIVLDDLQIPGVRRAADSLPPQYSLEVIVARQDRAYGIAWRTR